jgi:hypothetical protein
LSPVLSKLSLDVESIYLNQKVKDNTSIPIILNNYMHMP